MTAKRLGLVDLQRIARYGTAEHKRRIVLGHDRHDEIVHLMACYQELCDHAVDHPSPSVRMAVITSGNDDHRERLADDPSEGVRLILEAYSRGDQDMRDQAREAKLMQRTTARHNRRMR